MLAFAALTLTVALLLTTFVAPVYQTQEKYAAYVSKQIEVELKKLDSDIAKVIEAAEQNSELSFSSLSFPSQYDYYIFQKGRPVFWSTNNFLPDYSLINGDSALYFASDNQSRFLVRKVSLNGEGLELFALLTLYEHFPLANQYIESGFNKRIFASSNMRLYEIDTEQGAPVYVKGKPMFWAVFMDDYRLNIDLLQIIAFALILAAIILTLVFLRNLISHYIRNGKVQTGFLILVGGLTILRGIFLVTDFPFSLVELKLFDPAYYASSYINPSLGDLLLNMIVVVLWVGYLFRYFYKFDLYRNIIRADGPAKDIASISLASVSFFTLYYIYFLFKSLNVNSQWAFDINQDVDFPSLKITGYFIIFMAAAIYFMATHTIYKIYMRINRRSRFYRIFDFGIGALLFIVLTLAFKANFLAAGIVNAVFFAVIHLLDLPSYVSRIQYKTFFYYFMTALAISAVWSYVVAFHEGKSDLDQRRKMADELLIENDYLGEYLLNEAIDNIMNDPFIRGRMLTPFLSKEIIGQKIKEIHLSDYFDRYDVKVYLFGPNGQPLSGMASANYYTIKSEFSGYTTEFEDIFFRSVIGSRSPKQYLAFIELERFGNEKYNIGNIIIDLTLKRIIPNSVYPELMVDKNYLGALANPRYNEFSYAIVSEHQIVYSSGPFNYSRDFNKSYMDYDKLYETGIRVNSYRHFARRDVENERTIIVSSRSYPFLHVVSNFSFLFLALIFFIILSFAVLSLYFSFGATRMNYAAKIQLYTNFAFFIPLLVVSVTTLSVLISSYKRDVEKDYLTLAEKVSEEIVEPMYDYYRNASDKEELSGRLAQIANYTDVDINLYNKNGRLLTTNQPMIYEKDILSEFINPEAIAAIIEENSSSLILDETVGKLSYKSTYVGVKYFLSGELIGILSVPFFGSKLELEQQIIVVLTRIINIFTFVLIVSLVLSYFASKWLTFPLRLITQKIRRTTLSEYNEPLTWHSSDEIGLMVGEYNRMLENLEESKKALSRSEKESAWREMAKQVAHEIKNPLTPMKLTLQHLRRMLEKTMPENGAFVEKPINTLLHHVDTLSDIAQSFAAFAQMPAPASEKVEVSSILRQTVGLYANEESGKIETNIEEGQFYTTGDAQWMGRIFSNLIINGLQAVPAGRKALVCVSLRKTANQRLLIEFKDNGAGVPENIREKIFIPNFSTKFTGSGIGLAVAKRGVEHAGGRIWFESEENEGTTFFIELPLINP